MVFQSVTLSFLLLLLLFLLCTTLSLATSSPSSHTTSSPTTTSTNICGQNSTIGLYVISVLNLTFPGLEKVKAAVSINDLNTACEALAEYYKNANTSAWYRHSSPIPTNSTAGGIVDEMVFHDIWYLAGVDITSHIPRMPDGGLNWTYKGPRDDVEFMNCLNRHDSFDYLLSAWLSTGNPIYSTFYDKLIRDWVLHLPCPNALALSSTNCVPFGWLGGGAEKTCTWETVGSLACHTGTTESPWRSLEMGIRMSAEWPMAFFGFQNAIEVTTDARVLTILAVGEHNAALLLDDHHEGQGTENWEMVQWRGVLTSCVSWPELLNCSGLVDFAFHELQGLLKNGVYPDGVETEQASGYDMATASDFFSSISMASFGGITPPITFKNAVEAMFNYGAYAADPMGCMPRNGDSDLCGSGYNQQVTDYFNRTDWLYIHSNEKNGTVPSQLSTLGPSSIFPWAGQVILRSDYSRLGTWVFFDIGPYGSSGHGHRDKLNVNMNARGSMLLADSGRFAYAGTDLSATLHVEYGRNASAHNTLVIDNCDQLPTPAINTEPIPTNSYSFSQFNDTVFGSMDQYDGLVGKAIHSRSVYFERKAWGNEPDGDYTVIIDQISTGGIERTVMATWHTHPNATVILDPLTNYSTITGVDITTGKLTNAQVCVIPAKNVPWSKNCTIIRGQYQNQTQGLLWQGWYSQSYDDAWEASTLVYTGTVSSSTSTLPYAWLLVPSNEAIDCNLASISVESFIDNKVTVTVVLPGGIIKSIVLQIS
jgi:hypothetical protein